MNKDPSCTPTLVSFVLLERWVARLEDLREPGPLVTRRLLGVACGCQRDRPEPEPQLRSWGVLRLGRLPVDVAGCCWRDCVPSRPMD
ncbi:hypothetical protein NDU88_006623 [Pleurodeles waltl]|uniref:Uncharacterized protein n=1 Tax=Pleurodeles waltl TaxID=8319 RepID=A0AAV7WFC1_PLEWA|nr:hypothetical protein NDU88_006623 [Pleurodeles waltl]